MYPPRSWRSLSDPLSAARDVSPRPTQGKDRPCSRNPPTPVAGRITRRTLLRATTATAGALATAVAFAELETPAEAAASFVKGVDISWAPQMEARGYSWKNAGGQTQDLLTLKGYNITAVRLRTFVNPSNDPANGHCGINEVAAFAKRVKASGMSIMLDYMFGDTWNSVGVQNPPAAWRNMNYTRCAPRWART
jgi:arabinogalactan endo-1,4-beta-galactosidase